MISENLGCTTTSVILNLQNFKRDSYISVICQASLMPEEDRKADADTHLAMARSQNTGTGISGDTTKDKRQPHKRLSFFIHMKKEGGQEGEN